MTNEVKVLLKEIKLLFLTLLIGGVIAFLALSFGALEGMRYSSRFGLRHAGPFIATIVTPYLLLLIYRILKVIFRTLKGQNERNAP